MPGTTPLVYPRVDTEKSNVRRRLTPLSTVAVGVPRGVILHGEETGADELVVAEVGRKMDSKPAEKKRGGNLIAGMKL
ncbi:hypothetical protein EV2_045626 [Malus domestica]